MPSLPPRDPCRSAGMLSILLCSLFMAFPLALASESCKDISEPREEAWEVGFSAGIDCGISEKANVTWYKYSSNVPISKNVDSRVYQDQTWILFVSLRWNDSGIYQCVINNTTICHVKLTVLNPIKCDPFGSSQVDLANEYLQTLQLGNDGRLICYVDFPSSWIVNSTTWYKDCREIRGERFSPLNNILVVNNASREDRGIYYCITTLIHAKKSYKTQTRISVTVLEEPINERIFPKIIYPRNNSIEVQPGSFLIVDCNITDARGNTNPRSWKVNGTLVDTYYNKTKRIREGIEVPVRNGTRTFYTVNITFFEVKMEDYNHPFTCHAGIAAAYFILRLPVPDFRVYFLGGLLGLMCVLVCATCAYSVFKIDIVLWYRRAFRSTRTIEDGKLYDAYVLYPMTRESRSHEVDTLVLKILPEVLERQCGYKLFIFGRDGIPGQARANVIDENIKLCRRLLLIIVPDSLSFELLKTASEEQIAIYNALVQDGMKVILIELDKVPDYTALPESIQYIRRKHGALRWNEDLARQSPCAKSKFWKKVRYHMPPQQCSPSTPVQLLSHKSCDFSTGHQEASAPHLVSVMGEARS